MVSGRKAPTATARIAVREPILDVPTTDTGGRRSLWRPNWVFWGAREDEVERGYERCYVAGWNFCPSDSPRALWVAV